MFPWVLRYLFVVFAVEVLWPDTVCLGDKQQTEALECSASYTSSHLWIIERKPLLLTMLWKALCVTTAVLIQHTLILCTPVWKWPAVTVISDPFLALLSFLPCFVWWVTVFVEASGEISCNTPVNQSMWRLFSTDKLSSSYMTQVMLLLLVHQAPYQIDT